MVLLQSLPILEQFRSARTCQDRITTLQSVKNDTVGHALKKSKWVQLGVLRPIIQVITIPRAPVHLGTSRDSQDGGRDPSAVVPLDDLSEDDVARLQALELIGIFASGGPSFLTPLHAADAIPAVLSCLDPHTNPPRLVYAALRSLVTISKATLLVDSSATPPPPITITSLADTLFTAPPILHALHNIIGSRQQNWWAESMTNVALNLIGPLCCEERHQIALAKAGILDDLAVRVASIVVARGQVIPGAEIAAEKEGLRDEIPAPASPRLDVAAVLSAVAAIVGDSRLRACMLLYAPAVLAIFPQLEFASTTNDIYAAWNALCLGGLTNLHDQPLGALDLLLPAIPSQQSRAYFAQSSPFPPLGVSLSRDNLVALGLSSSSSRKRTGSHGGPQHAHQAPPGWAGGLSREGAASSWSPTGALLAAEWEPAETESPMIPWLIFMVRSTSGMQRLAAASVLTSLFKSQLASKSREAAMAMLIVPLLLRMLDDAANRVTKEINNSHNTHAHMNSSVAPPSDDNTVAEQRAITETALIVLARLVANREVLQKAAIDGNATAILAKLLKASYEPSPNRPALRPWNPTPASSRTACSEEPLEDPTATPQEAADARTLGSAGQNALLAHRIRLREATLKAVTALIASKYDYQKQFVEQDVMPYVVASLDPTPSKPRNARDKTKAAKEDGTAVDEGEKKVDPEYGRNPVGVLVAACNCVRMLSRSIAILRTTLLDAGVALPILDLLQHPEMDVQIASTAVVCNLVTETSPMREQYAEADVMHILCNHAHSLNSSLRLNALWALKHFVDGVEPSRKKACLEQLGSGWLVRLIDPDAEDEAALFSWGRADSRTAAASAAAAAVGRSSIGGYGGNSNNNLDEDVVMDGPDDDVADVYDRDEENEEATDSDGKMATPQPAGTSSSSLYQASFPRMSHERSRTGRLRQAEAKLAVLREAELSQPRRNRSDDIEIQEQGLNFIRNLIGPGPSAAGSTGDTMRDTTEMIDYLFSEIGEDRLFRILLSKLRVKVLHAAGASSPSSRVLHPHGRIIEAVVFILVHISASVPRYRQLVIAQTELLKALVAQFSSRNKGVRLALCHLLSNLTWREDASDTAAAAGRTLELKRLGLLTKLQVLQLEDSELDVREQAKMAIHQMGPQNV